MDRAMASSLRRVSRQCTATNFLSENLAPAFCRTESSQIGNTVPIISQQEPRLDASPSKLSVSLGRCALRWKPAFLSANSSLELFGAKADQIQGRSYLVVLFCKSANPQQSRSGPFKLSASTHSSHRSPAQSPVWKHIKPTQIIPM